MRTRKRRLLFTLDDSFGEAGRRALLLRFEQFCEREQGTRLGKDIEELHDMRVASRRMRAAFRIFREGIGKERLEPFQDDLRWIAAELGKVRDFDVFLAFLTEYQKGLAPEEQPGIQTLVEDRRSARGTARRSLLRAMNSPRFSQFKERFVLFLTEELPPLLSGDPQKPVRMIAPGALRNRFKTVCRYAPILQENPSPESHHALRIATKRLRYTAEFFKEVYGKSLDDLIRQCVAVQDALGEVHDVDVHEEFLNQYRRGLVGRSKAVLSQRQALRNLIAAEQARRVEQQREFESIWQIWSHKGKQKRITRRFDLERP